MQHGSSRMPKQEALPNAIFGHESKNWTALHEAVAAGDDKRVEVLLSSNVDRMAKESNNGNTPLHEAAMRGFSRCVKLICTPPPSKSQHKEKNRLKARVANTIEALHNSTLGIINNEGLSALHLAVQNGHNQSTRELLIAGADPDVQNNYGDTPLHTACRYGHAGATRILLSASIDPNKTNLNGDTALHITSAMGRRKLTRILLESDARLDIKNAQGETPQNIALRKNYRDILEILNTPKRIRNRREKAKPSSSPQRRSAQDNPAKVINWSPYGCHYFPDPRAFPSPKLETLPKDPLKPGEQYFLDLAGNIHKGPLSVVNTCYCGPFFRHIENKLNCNRKSLKKYVNKTKERLGHKVQALAIKTNDQIEQLTRTMIADRIRCENKRQYLNEFLRRGEPFRSTFDNQSKCPKVERTLSRCRSLELLDNTIQDSKLTNSRSVDLLEDQAIQAIVHHPNEEEGESDTDDDSAVANAFNSQGQAAHRELQHIKLDELKLDFLKVSERLGDLLEKTTLIMERDSEQESKRHLSSMSPDYKPQQSSSSGQIYSRENQFAMRQDKDSPDNRNFDAYSHMERRYPNSSETSQNSNSWECEISPTEGQYYHRIGRSENMFQSVIKALRKDATFLDLNKDEIQHNENADKTTGDKLMYKERGHESSVTDVSFHPPLSTNPQLLKRRPLRVQEGFVPISSMFYTNPLISQEDNLEYTEGLEMAPNPNESVEKVEIKNSEIKCLKKSNAGQVKDMVAQLQIKIDSNVPQDHQNNNIAPSEKNPVSSSNNPLFSNFSGMRPQLNNYPNINEKGSVQPPNTSFQTDLYVERHIPKDAYFHELPNRPKTVQRHSQNIQPGCLPSTELCPTMDTYYPNFSQRYPMGSPIDSAQTPQNLNVSMPREYASQNAHILNQPLRSPSSQLPNSVGPAIFRKRLPPEGGLNNEPDLDEMPTVGLYNNVSSLV
ncbi:uncharacterized protein LOC115622985 [Scaptodrosophila lebanonensis]|uniref:Uncharacterized protein LOC115622985 n=1 Tax=Drosophila lebanonensis TaxID=7225 RepID=A0A6J2TCZ6_DROLE|nr:uncharacterized protein LOC115622985 [Scaptodrosophila lebanonensis]